MYVTLQTCTLQDGQGGELYVTYIFPQLKGKKRGKKKISQCHGLAAHFITYCTSLHICPYGESSYVEPVTTIVIELSTIYVTTIDLAIERYHVCISFTAE